MDYVDYRLRSVCEMTVKIELVVWKAFLNYCLKRKYIKDNPFSLYPIKKVQGRLVYLSLAEVEKLKTYQDASRPWLHDLLNIALLTGFRKGELQTLRWDNIYPHTIIAEGKVGSREFPNNSRLQAIFDSIDKKGPWVFYSNIRQKTMLNGDYISRSVKKAFRELGFCEKYSLHT